MFFIILFMFSCIKLFVFFLRLVLFKRWKKGKCDAVVPVVCDQTCWFLIPAHHQGEGTSGWSAVDEKHEAFGSSVTLLTDTRLRISSGTCCVSRIVSAHRESDFIQRPKGERAHGAIYVSRFLPRRDANSVFQVRRGGGAGLHSCEGL